MAAVDDLLGRHVGGFVITRFIGEGGMARVYEAENPTTRARLAVKVLHEELLAQDPNALARFHREAIAASQFAHPNIVEVRDVGRLDGGGRHYIAMELLDGESLATLLAASGGLLPADLAWRILAQMADALVAVHAAGLIHRDLKPENVMVVAALPRATIKLVDFGLAKYRDSRGASGALTSRFMFLGSPSYSAPEQGLAIDIDHRADIYAFGAVAYELFTGHLPHRSDDPKMLVQLKTHVPATDVRAYMPDLSEAVADAIMACLAIDRDQRPATVQQAAAPLMYAVPGGVEIARAVAPAFAALAAAPRAAPTERTLQLPASDEAVASAAMPAPLTPAAPSEAHPERPSGSTQLAATVESDRESEQTGRVRWRLVLTGAVLGAAVVVSLAHGLRPRAPTLGASPTLAIDAGVAIDAVPVAIDAAPVVIDAAPVVIDAAPVAIDAGRANPRTPVWRAPVRGRPVDALLAAAYHEAFVKAPRWPAVRWNAREVLRREPSNERALRYATMAACRLKLRGEALGYLRHLAADQQAKLRGYCAKEAALTLP